MKIFYYSAPVGALQSVCLSVCLSVREHISGTAGPIFTKFFVHIPCGHCSVLLWGHCDTLCTVLTVLWMTSRLAVVGHMLGIAIPGQTLRSINALLLFCYYSVGICCDV